MTNKQAQAAARMARHREMMAAGTPELSPYAVNPVPVTDERADIHEGRMIDRGLAAWW